MPALKSHFGGLVENTQKILAVAAWLAASAVSAQAADEKSAASHDLQDPSVARRIMLVVAKPSETLSPQAWGPFRQGGFDPSVVSASGGAPGVLVGLVLKDLSESK